MSAGPSYSPVGAAGGSASKHSRSSSKTKKLIRRLSGGKNKTPVSTHKSMFLCICRSSDKDYAMSKQGGWDVVNATMFDFSEALMYYIPLFTVGLDCQGAHLTYIANNARGCYHLIALSYQVDIG